MALAIPNEASFSIGVTETTNYMLMGLDDKGSWTTP